MKLEKILFRKRNWPTVYVLIRLYCRDVEQYDCYFEELHPMLQSVLDNKCHYMGKLVLLINDDTSQAQRSAYLKYVSDRNMMLKKMFGEQGSDWIVTDAPGDEGSAAAMLRLRKHFVSIHGDVSDIAITLDHDDRLQQGAVQCIARRMKPGGIVVSSFVETGDLSLDIVGDKGRSHRRLVQRMCLHSIIGRIMAVPGGKDIAHLSSIGWTKSYSKKVMNDYTNDLEALFGGSEQTNKFFVEHPAFEDFIDFYVLLFKDLPVSSVWRKTHVYVKTSNSITATPKFEDFSRHRTAMLATLIDLCYAHEHPSSHTYHTLCDDYKDMLLQYVSVKARAVENILSSYRKHYFDGESKQYAEYGQKTYYGSFIGTFCNYVLGGLRSETSVGNFRDLVSVVVCQKELNGKKLPLDANPRRLLECLAFSDIKTKEGGGNGDDAVKELMSGKKPPHRIQYIYLWCAVCLLIALVVAAIVIMNKKEVNIHEYQVLITGVGSVLVGVLALLVGEISKVKIISENEEATSKLYYSEFLDIIRHLEANIRIFAQIRKGLKDGKVRVQNLHFENMIWPDSSSLFANEMPKLIDRERVDDFARLKVNLRNVNNTVQWLDRQQLQGQELLDAIEWEMARHFGYLINFYYMRDNNFSFPTQEQVDRYVFVNDIKNKLTALFMDYDVDQRYSEVEHFIGRYYKDRRTKREVLMY